MERTYNCLLFLRNSPRNFNELLNLIKLKFLNIFWRKNRVIKKMIFQNKSKRDLLAIIENFDLSVRSITKKKIEKYLY